MENSRVFRFVKAFAIETFDILSNVFCALSYLAMFLSWNVWSFTLSVREKRGFDVSKFEEELKFEQVYVMALQLKTPKRRDPNVQDVWRQYVFLSKRQAYKVLDEWKRQESRRR